METIITVPKEMIGQSPFASQEVLSSPADMERRKFYLHKALALGNLYRNKVALTYRLVDGSSQRVVTTVWAVSENHVTLKGGRNLPIHAISEVEI